MNKFDIYWFDFKNKQDPETSKLRPVLLLDEDIIIPIAEITSHESRGGLDYKIENWSESGLPKQSTIRFGQTWLIPTYQLDNYQYIGHLSEEDIQKIKELKLVK